MCTVGVSPDTNSDEYYYQSSELKDGFCPNADWTCTPLNIARTCVVLILWVVRAAASTRTQMRQLRVHFRQLSDAKTTLISVYLHVIECTMQGQWGLINQAAVTKQEQEQNQQEEQEARARQQQLDAVCHNFD